MKDEDEYRRYWKLESFKHAVNSGRHIMQNGVLLNGGAAVALMTFLGHAFESSSDNHPVNLGLALLALILFGLGAGFSAMSFGTTYFSQEAFTHSNNEKSESKGKKWRGATIKLVSASYASFLLGLISTGLSFY